MNRSLAPALAVLIFALGLAAGWWLRAEPRVATEREIGRLDSNEVSPPDEASSDLELPRTRVGADPAPRSPAAAGDEDAAPGGEADALFDATLLAHAAEGIVIGWKSVRPDDPRDDEVEEGVATFQEQTLTLPPSIGRRLAERRSNQELAAEDARTGGVLTTLARLEAGGPGPLFEIVTDRATFDRFFRSETSGPAVDGPSVLSSAELAKREPVVDGSTLQFSAGVFALEDFGSYWRERFPRDLTIRGVGKGATLLVLRSDLSAYDTVRNLTIERCTIHANNNYLFDIRKPAMSLTLREVRVTGWDMGAGSSCLFGTEGLALRAADCEFLGGYGRSPQHGQLFDVRHNGLLARFERCVIERTEPFGNFGAGATVVFSACQLRDVWSWPSEQIPANVRLDGSAIDWYDRSSGQELARDLNDLFPRWKTAMQR